MSDDVSHTAFLPKALLARSILSGLAAQSACDKGRR